jgi:hypothetical protein
VVAKGFGWLGQTRRRSAAAKACTVVQAWWDAWALSAATVGLIEKPADMPSGAYRYVEGRGVYALRVEGDLVGALTGLSGGRGQALAAHLELAALTDLAERMAGGTAGESGLREIDTLPDTLADPRWGGFCCAFDIGGLRLGLWLDRQAAMHWAPPEIARTAALTRRADAVAPATVRLSATLDLGDITLGELHDLAPGDVIATLAPLTRRLDVTLAGHEKSFYRAQLGERNGRRALRLSSSDTLESE